MATKKGKKAVDEVLPVESDEQVESNAPAVSVEDLPVEEKPKLVAKKVFEPMLMGYKTVWEKE